MFTYWVLSTVVSLAIGTCCWAFLDRGPKHVEYNPFGNPPVEDETGLWSPLKLALVEHETGVHPCTRECAEAGCAQCRLIVVPRGPWSGLSPTARVMAGLDTPNDERRRREYPELYHDAPLPGPRIIPVAPRCSN